MKNSRSILFFSLLVFFLFLLLFFNLITGPVKISPGELFAFIFDRESLSEINRTILSNFRFPKAITAILAGAALSVSGLQMQTIFRNPLAGPYVLGISSGASLGVAIVILGFNQFFSAQFITGAGSWLQIMAAWAGSATVLFLILFVSMRVKDVMTILILGILFGSAASSLVSIMQYFSQQSTLKAFVIWTMGSLGSPSQSQLKILVPCIIIGLLLAFFSSKPLNALLLGETYAKTIGVNIHRSRIIVFISTSILAGSITAFCGPIGFIGIAVPHIVRMLFKTSDHRIIVPASLLMGAVVLLLADIISQVPENDIILPINSVTALLGIPVVIWLVVRNRKLTVIN